MWGVGPGQASSAAQPHLLAMLAGALGGQAATGEGAGAQARPLRRHVLGIWDPRAG